MGPALVGGITAGLGVGASVCGGEVWVGLTVGVWVGAGGVGVTTNAAGVAAGPTAKWVVAYELP